MLDVNNRLNQVEADIEARSGRFTIGGFASARSIGVVGSIEQRMSKAISAYVDASAYYDRLSTAKSWDWQAIAGARIKW